MKTLCLTLKLTIKILQQTLIKDVDIVEWCFSFKIKKYNVFAMHFTV